MIRNASAILIACLLVACGGGGGGGSNGSGTSSGSPAVAVDKTSPSVGDFYTYKMTGYSESGGNRYNYQPSYDTNLTTAVVDGTATVKPLFGEQTLYWFADTATLNGSYQGASKVKCMTTYAAGAYGPPAKLALNVSWNNSTAFTSDCGASEPLRSSKLASTGSVVAMESITVGAGTFQAYKLTVNVIEQRTDKYSYGNQHTVSSTRSSKLTTWVDVDTGVELKSAIEETVTGFVDKPIYTLNRELVGLSHAKSARQVLVAERFSGASWKGSYSGKLSGACKAIILEGGKILARCAEGTSTDDTLFPEGTINNSGQVNFALPSGGANALKFTGQAESLTKISGTWSDGAGATGTWVFTRDN